MDSVAQRYQFTQEDCRAGFAGLVAKRFNGDPEAAAAYVADLGRASFYYNMKPGLAIRTLAKHRESIPELFIYDDGGDVADIAWKSEWLANRYSVVF